MPKDMSSAGSRATRAAANALIVMCTGAGKRNGLRPLSEEAKESGFNVGYSTISNRANTDYFQRNPGYNQDIVKLLSTRFAADYDDDHGVHEGSSVAAVELWFEMMDEPSGTGTAPWEAYANRADEILAGRTDLLANVVRFSISFQLSLRGTRDFEALLLRDTEAGLRKTISMSSFGLDDYDFDGVFRVASATFEEHGPIMDLVEAAEDFKGRSVALSWQHDPRFSPTGVLLSTALLQLAQLATLRGDGALQEFYRWLRGEGRFPLLFVRGRVFDEVPSLMAAAEALFEAYPEDLSGTLKEAIGMIETVFGSAIETVPGYDRYPSQAFRNAVAQIKANEGSQV